MTAPRAFLIPTDWGRRPHGRLVLVEDGPLRVAGAASVMSDKRELISGTAFTSSGANYERDYIRWQTGYSNMNGFYWPGGTGVIIARAARFVAGQINYFFGGCLCNDMSTNVSAGNFTMGNSTTGSFGITGGTIVATSAFNPEVTPYFVAKSLQESRADMAAYNQGGRLLNAFSRTGVSGQNFSAQQITSNYFGGPTSAQSRNGALTEFVVLVGGLPAADMHAVVSQFYGLFFRPAVERTFFVPAPAAGGKTGTVAVTLGTATQSASGKVTHKGAAANTLATATQVASGKVTHKGTIAETMDAATQVMAGYVTHRGTSSVALSSATMAASGSVGTDKVGTVAGTLANVTSAGSGRVVHRATVSVTLAGVTSSGSGKLTHRGSLAASIAGATMEAAGTRAGYVVTGYHMRRFWRRRFN